MKSRPIIFSGPTVRALLEGRKTHTRRIMKSRKDLNVGCLLSPNEIAGEVNRGDYSNSPYGRPGDLLWVRESWQHSNHPDGLLDRDCAIFYRADYANDSDHEGKYWMWRSSIHMPRWASRFTLRITNIHLERLRSIRSEDALLEGIENISNEGRVAYGIRGYIEAQHPICAYQLLWESINGPGSLDANPWVWVLDFEVIKANVDEVLKP